MVSAFYSGLLLFHRLYGDLGVQSPTSWFSKGFLLTASCMCMKEPFIHWNLGSQHLTLLGILLRMKLLVLWVMLCGCKKYLKLRFWVSLALNFFFLSSFENTHSESRHINKLFWQPHRSRYGMGKSWTNMKESLKSFWCVSAAIVIALLNLEVWHKALLCAMYIAAILCDSFLIEPSTGFIGESGAKEAAPLLASSRKQRGLQRTERESIGYQGSTGTILWQRSSQKGFETCRPNAPAALAGHSTIREDMKWQKLCC